MKSTNTKSAFKTLIFLIIGLVLALFLISNIGYLMLKSNLPDFLDQMVESAKSNKRIDRTIGGFKSFEYTFNEKDLDKDTLKYEVIVKGETSYLKMSGYATKKDGEWSPSKIDSTYTSY